MPYAVRENQATVTNVSEVGADGDISAFCQARRAGRLCY